MNFSRSQLVVIIELISYLLIAVVLNIVFYKFGWYSDDIMLKLHGIYILLLAPRLLFLALTDWIEESKRIDGIGKI